GVSPSIGSHAFVPSGYPGAGNLIVASYNASIAYRIPFTVDGTGLHTFSAPTNSVNVLGTATGPEGIAYVPLGSAGFPVPSMVVSAYGMNKVVVFDVGADGLPITTTVRDMVIDLVGAEGAWIDPLTGDFLFSTFGGSNRVIRVSGFEVPNAVPSSVPMDRGLDVFPNPSTGVFQFAVGAPGSRMHLEVFDPIGAVVSSREFISNGSYTLDLTGQAPGIYAVQIRCNGNDRTQRIVLE
ncbi:MAG: T9SS type A sorting domain-containing protein, partial [Flavobacteriales bacterium]|nr:T9SS type A sorting domain-containing protein [Flavobacteriales bacterium]